MNRTDHILTRLQHCVGGLQLVHARTSSLPAPHQTHRKAEWDRTRLELWPRHTFPPGLMAIITCLYLPSPNKRHAYVGLGLFKVKTALACLSSHTAFGLIVYSPSSGSKAFYFRLLKMIRHFRNRLHLN